MDDPGMGYSSRRAEPVGTFDVHGCMSGGSKLVWKSDGESLATLSETEVDGPGKREYLFLKAQQLEFKVKHLIDQIDAEMEREMAKLRKTKDEAYSRIRRDLACAERQQQVEKFEYATPPNSAGTSDGFCRCMVEIPVDHVLKTPDLPIVSSPESIRPSQVAYESPSLNKLDSQSLNETRVAVNSFNAEESCLKKPTTTTLEPTSHHQDDAYSSLIKRDPWTTHNDIILSSGDCYTLQVNLNGYPQENLVVEVNDGNILTLEATLEEATDDGGKLMRLMQRAYTLPMNVDKAGLCYELDSSSGVLKIKLLKRAVTLIENNLLAAGLHLHEGDERCYDSHGLISSDAQTTSTSRKASSSTADDERGTKSFCASDSGNKKISKRSAAENSASHSASSPEADSSDCDPINSSSKNKYSRNSVLSCSPNSSNIGSPEQNSSLRSSPRSNQHHQPCEDLELDVNLIDLALNNNNKGTHDDTVSYSSRKIRRRVPSEVVLSDDPVSESMTTTGTHGPGCPRHRRNAVEEVSPSILKYNVGSIHVHPSITPIDKSPSVPRKQVAFDSEDISDIKETFNFDPMSGAQALEKLVKTKMKPPTPVRMSLLTPIVKRDVRIKPNNKAMMRGTSAHSLLPTGFTGNYVSSWFSTAGNDASKANVAGAAPGGGVGMHRASRSAVAATNNRGRHTPERFAGSHHQGRSLSRH